MPRTSPQPSTNGYITPAEVAKMCRVSRFTVYGWIRTGKLPAVKLGRKLIRIDPQELQYKRDHDQWRKESVSSQRCRAATTNGGPTPQPSAPPVVMQTDTPGVSMNGNPSAATTTNGHGEIEWDEGCPCLSPTRRHGKFVGLIRRILGVITPRPEFVAAEATPSTPSSTLDPDPSLTLAAVERAHIRRVLEQHHSNIDQAARVLGLSADTLRKKIGEMVREGITQNTANAPINVLNPGTNRWLE